MFRNLLTDLRYSLRALLLQPAFSVVAVLTLALGIGANAAIFSVLHGLFLAPLPYPDGERLVDVYNTYPTSSLQYAGSSIPDYLDRREQAEGLADLTLYTGGSVNLAEVETLYWPHRQLAPNVAALLLRGPAAGNSATTRSLREIVQSVDPEQLLFNVTMLDQRIATSVDQQRAPMSLLAGFAAITLLLSAIGISAVLAFSVSQRTGELGVRMLIGAGQRQIIGLVLRHGARLTVLGLAIGVVLALLFGQLGRAQLFGVAAYDPLTFVCVPAFLAAVALFACWLPARRAAGIDPLVAFRHV